MSNFETSNSRPKNEVVSADTCRAAYMTQELLSHDDYYGAYMLNERIQDHQEASEEQGVIIHRGHNHIDNNYGRFGRFSEQPSVVMGREVLKNWDEIINARLL